MSDIWPQRESTNGSIDVYQPNQQAAPGTYPLPAGRGLWRFTLHKRAFADNVPTSATAIVELADVRSRRLTQELNKATTLIFSVEGHSPSAALIRELQHDVIAWRWDDQQGKDVPLFRGPVTQAQDTLSEQTYTVNFTCHDYLAMLARRFLTAPANYSQWDQDDIAYDLIHQRAQLVSTSSGVSLNPGAYLPLVALAVDPASVARAHSGQLRDRNYLGNQSVFDAVTQLGAVINGFDFDDCPGPRLNAAWTENQLRIFYPYQGVLRTNPALIYGVTVSTVTRSIDSAQYANYQRALGNNNSSDSSVPQLYGETWNTDANNITVAPQGLWMAVDNAADVSIQSTLNAQAQGNLSRSAVLTGSYSLTLRPGFYSLGAPNMGDVVPLIIQAGRLNVNTTIRVVGIDYNIGDDGQEDVILTVGRPDTTIADIFTATDTDVNALARR
jgi:hypothetical protein